MRIPARVATGRDQGQPCQVPVPPLRVGAARIVVRETGVAESNQGRTVFLPERDLDGGRSGWEPRHGIEVEGFTDNTPIGNPAFASNWELSAVRATTVVRLFAANGVAEERLAAVGRGANRPIASNVDQFASVAISASRRDCSGTPR